MVNVIAGYICSDALTKEPNVSELNETRRHADDAVMIMFFSGAQGRIPVSVVPSEEAQWQAWQAWQAIGHRGPMAHGGDATRPVGRRENRSWSH